MSESKVTSLPNDDRWRNELRRGDPVLIAARYSHQNAVTREAMCDVDGEGDRVMVPLESLVRPTVQSEDAPASYTPASDDEVKLALAEYHDSEEYNMDEVNMRSALDAVLYRRGSSLQAKGSVCEHAANEGAYYEGKSYVEFEHLRPILTDLQNGCYSDAEASLESLLRGE